MDQDAALGMGTEWTEWPLALCAALGLAAIVWRLVALGGGGRRAKNVLKEVDELLTQRRFREALEFTRDTDAPMARVVHAGLVRADEGAETVTEAIRSQGLIERRRLETGLLLLRGVSTVAPLLGLAGTALGLLSTFEAAGTAGGMDATLLAVGIKAALLPSAFGLLIAVPVSVARRYIVSRVQAMVVDMEESAQLMVETLRAIEAIPER